MNKIIATCILLYIISISTVYAQKGIQYKNYKDAVHGVSINYPATWEHINDSGLVLGFMSPKAATDVHSDALFSLDITSTDVDMTKSIMDDYEKVCGKEFKDYKKVKRGTQKIGEFECSKLYFEATPRDTKLMIMICIFVDLGKEYIFTCSSKPATFKQYINTFDKMIESFKTAE